MADDLTVEKGTKIDEAEAATLNPAEMGIATTDRPAEAEVEGQRVYFKVVMCPHCGNVGWIRYDTTRYKFYRCGRCGLYFRM